MKKFKVDKSQILSKDAQKKVVGGWSEPCEPGRCYPDSSLMGGGEFGGVCVIAAPAPGGGTCYGQIEDGMCCIY